MQDKNSSSSSRPKAGDGTQDTRKKQDANWYGASEQPQEEFTADHQSEGGQGPIISGELAKHGPVSAVEPHDARTSEGTPFNADSGREILTPERAVERDPKKPTDVRH